MDMVRYMLKSKNLPKFFCSKVIAYAIYMLNSYPIESNCNKTPQGVYGMVISLKFDTLACSGCIACAHILNVIRKKKP